MPRGSCLRTTMDERLGEEWTVTHDLLAMLVEVTSVPAAEMKLKKPVEIPRPGDRGTKARTPDAVVPGPEAAMKRGIAMLASTSKGARG